MKYILLKNFIDRRIRWEIDFTHSKKEVHMKRKDFLIVSGKIFLGGVLTALGISCKSPVSPDEDEKFFESVSTTSPYAHTHSVKIQKSEIENPPSNGISRFTTNTQLEPMRNYSGHVHTFSMTQEQLVLVKNGEVVQITTSEDVLHTHDFYIEKWY
jgi:hypothetical protein